ncbi:hypothetical protein [Deinococcus sp.]|uniref:hypothetical protein n=1 Tax=Deinococcus sp. TaxID=47478 RepID=UPI003C7B7393
MTTCDDGAVPSDDFAPSDDQALLIAEGDRLATDLETRLRTTAQQQGRLQFMGRTLAVNLARVFIQTVEDVTRKVGKPLRAWVVADALERPEIVVVGADGEVREHVPVDELLNRALYLGSRLHPTVETHLRAAAEAGNEHLATRALVACLKAKPVLEVSLPYLSRFTR